MDIIELLKAILFGIVEGITEWLPISSTGHMLLLEEVLPLDVSPQFWDMFLVVIQLGAILAVCILFFKPLNPFAPSKGVEGRRNTWRLWAKIIVACLPAAIIGIPLDDVMTLYLGSPFIIAAALIVYGIAFIVIEQRREMRARQFAEAETAGYRGAHFAHSTAEEPTSLAVLADADARVTNLASMPWKTAIGIGAFQVLSLVPGTSRSGSTIIGGLLLGCSRSVAAEFTFYLAIPVMFGASALRLGKYLLEGNVFTSNELMVLLVGSLVAFLVSLAAIRFLMGFVRKHDFKPFGWYRIALGIVVIIFFTVVR